ncbi:MAG: nucleotidyltransferase family protein [Candidatus Thiodiazotropha sp. (ex Ctena orbiculata)]|nr:nucleotidyltransferase family protein [Candidatus Thiodiazotropha taylori]PUB87604.1 MAG: nucleotidyltransferase family protein [gamma proteobacterium symbiont of Ctena orbiculata]MBT2996267.1 nucleotidyltransferase family protein [Candidatus Thiodiazotropha taylori]MBT3000299.1 nucleotidyltransferase family protein [Candidatus Thiodiazotropha taylori]MBV2109297.1 nucleotidyltransferase family protein [Candidatus Thiodiazotropha taylori]
MSGIQGILLAAGTGQRFGRHKLLHPLPSGESMGVASARSLMAALPNCLAVIHPQDRQLAELFAGLGLSVVENSEAEQGMGRSLAAAVGASADAAGWVVALADMPWIAAETIRSVARALQQGASMAAPAYRQRRGHPVGFARQWRAPLLALRGDVGARHLLAAHPDELLLLPTDDPAVLLDIDREADLMRAP